MSGEFMPSSEQSRGPENVTDESSCSLSGVSAVSSLSDKLSCSTCILELTLTFCTLSRYCFGGFVEIMIFSISDSGDGNSSRPSCDWGGQ